MIIGVTGNIGSGKTTVAGIFEKEGFKLINADELGHKLLENNDIREKVVRKFGKGILTGNKIDRRKLKDIVFEDKIKLIALNKIMHPEIIKEIKRIVMRKGDFVIDAALLIEADALSVADKLIVVKINKKEQFRRTFARGKYTKEEIENIIRSQMPQDKKLGYADYIIDNSGSIENSEKQAREILKCIRK